MSAIAQACRHAAEHGLGWLEPGQSLQLHVSLVEQLPPLLRIYVGCAAVLYGDYRNADLVKIHIGSGKVSLMRYDDFEGQPLPRMVERVKIKLREQDIDYFAYGEDYEPPFLFHKSRYINEEVPALSGAGRVRSGAGWVGAVGLVELWPDAPGPCLPTLVGIAGPSRASIWFGRDPDLDDPCGRFLTFRQLIACGETQPQTGLANLPFAGKL